MAARVWLQRLLRVRLGVQMYNKQKEIEALEKRQALTKEQQEEEDAQSAGPARQNGASQQDQAYSNAAANGGLYRAPSHGAAPASEPPAPVDPVAEVAHHLKHHKFAEILLGVQMEVLSSGSCPCSMA